MGHHQRQEERRWDREEVGPAATGGDGMDEFQHLPSLSIDLHTCVFVCVQAFIQRLQTKIIDRGLGFAKGDGESECWFKL